MGKYDKQIVEKDKCPKCTGDLDTGWECNQCGFDARDIAMGRMKP